MQSHDRRIKQWLDDIENGRIRLPVFQRSMVWSARQAELLFESILRDMPAGAALILKVNAQDEMFASQPIESAPDIKDNVIEHLLDGQQRLTTIYQCLNNNFTGRKFFLEIPEINVKIDPKELQLSIRSFPNGRRARAKQWLDDPKQEFEKNLIPLNLFKDGFTVRQEFDSWISNSLVQNPDTHSKITWLSNLREFVGSIIADFNIPTLILNADTEIGTALDVFIRMNTSGTSLKEYDIVLAQLFHRTGEDLNQKLEELQDKYPETRDYLDLKAIVLPSIALLGKTEKTEEGEPKNIPHSPAKATYLREDFSELFKDNWASFDASIRPTISLLKELKIFQEVRIPTKIVIPVSIAVFGIYGATGDQAGRVRNVLKAYLWRSFLSPRYDRNTGSKMFQDFRRIRSHLNTNSDQITEIFEAPDWSLPIAQDIADVKWPTSTNRLAKGILAVINQAGAKDFASGRPLEDGNVLERELHHIFPKRYLSQNGLGDANLIVNCAFIEKKTNRIISSQPPAEYYEKREEYFEDAGEVNARFESHLIPVPELISNAYDEFKLKRAHLIKEEMTKLCLGYTEEDTSEANAYNGTEIELIYTGENERVEFKSSVRWDYKKAEVNKALGNSILKTIAGFANTRGGMLFIGVDDNQSIVGLEADLKAFRVQNSDKYELKLHNFLVSEFGVEKTSEIISSIKFITHLEKQICIVRVARSKFGTYVNELDKNGNKAEKFYIRSTNQTIPLSPSEENNYRKRMGLR